ncbi:molecular chaperone DnaJ [Rhodocyclus purpureus]|uniref:molecular chaperone DnaJ n=1 Tax=Rhodocyclus purpureus TaxID=1067 RepID=UPI0019131A84|nr:molecular chaperone DnaJ [Rhodocyclus purpureus]MBK5915209.1 hypothetical protein [Rhodocyclus purpureus]
MTPPSQFSLFADDPQPPALSARLVIAAEAPLGKDQKTFNSLIRKIEGARARLAEWEQAIPRFRQKYVSELLPLQEKETALLIQLAKKYDFVHAQKGLTSGERRKLSALIVQLTQGILDRVADDEIKAIYNLHSQSDYDAEEAAEQARMKDLLEDVLGMKLGDELDLRSPEEVLKRVEGEFRAQSAQEEAAARAQSARAQARAARQQAKREAEEKQLSQSIREVYRKMASALHPDREADPVERQRKTGLMQRVNDAYARGNLLQLLELQLQLEQIDVAHLANIGGERLKHYIKILRGQLSELEAELERVADGFCFEFGLSTFERIRPEGLMPIMKADLAHCAASIRGLQNDLDTAGDLRRLKAALKSFRMRRQRRSDDYDDFDLPF